MNFTKRNNSILFDKVTKISLKNFSKLISSSNIQYLTLGPYRNFFDMVLMFKSFTQLNIKLNI